MILAFADLHFGETTYSQVDSEGFYSAERECIRALEYIKARAARTDVDMIIFTGDFFHTNHPKPRLIKYTIGWLKEMDSLGKPFYLITGNHDASVYANALMFMHKLELANVHLIDAYTAAPTCIQWKTFNIMFLPYVQDAVTKNKDAFTYAQVEQVINTVKDNTIVVTHIVEPNATTGSEAYLFSKKVISVNLDTTQKYKNLIYLLGHIHRPQIYKKSNGATVVYPGSATYNDMSDLSQTKGYVLIKDTGEISVEPFVGVRRFFRYFIPANRTVDEYLKSIRLVSSSVIFLESTKPIEITQDLYDYLQGKGILIGKLIEQDKEIEKAQLVYETMDPYTIISEYIHTLNLENVSDYINYCHNKITKQIGAE